MLIYICIIIIIFFLSYTYEYMTNDKIYTYIYGINSSMYKYKKNLTRRR